MAEVKWIMRKVEELEPGDESKDYKFLTARIKDGIVFTVVELENGDRVRREFIPGSQIEVIMRDQDLAEREAVEYEESLLTALNSPEPRKELAKMGSRRNRALPVEPTVTEHGSTEPIGE